MASTNAASALLGLAVFAAAAGATALAAGCDCADGFTVGVAALTVSVFALAVTGAALLLAFFSMAAVSRAAVFLVTGVGGVVFFAAAATAATAGLAVVFLTGALTGVLAAVVFALVVAGLVEARLAGVFAFTFSVLAVFLAVTFLALRGAVVLDAALVVVTVFLTTTRPVVFLMVVFLAVEPVVFLPFVAALRAGRAVDGRDAAARAVAVLVLRDVLLAVVLVAWVFFVVVGAALLPADAFFLAVSGRADAVDRELRTLLLAGVL